MKSRNPIKGHPEDIERSCSLLDFTIRLTIAKAEKTCFPFVPQKVNEMATNTDSPTNNLSAFNLPVSYSLDKWP